jgi:hypothetical protein
MVSMIGMSPVFCFGGCEIKGKVSGGGCTHTCIYVYGLMCTVVMMWVCTQETQTTALGWGWAKSGGVSCEVFASLQLRDKSVQWQKCRNECSKTRRMTTQCQRYKYSHR